MATALELFGLAQFSFRWHYKQESRMKADDTTIKAFLEGSKEFIVLLFQRTYGWGKEPIRILWEHIGI